LLYIVNINRTLRSISVKHHVPSLSNKTGCFLPFIWTSISYKSFYKRAKTILNTIIWNKRFSKQTIFMLLLFFITFWHAYVSKYKFTNYINSGAGEYDKPHAKYKDWENNKAV
jgi:hypothetical protein